MRRLGLIAALAGAAGASLAGFSLAGVSAPDAATSTATTAVTVHVREWSFELSQETAPVGTVVFTVVNDGQSEPHDFAINGRTSAVLTPGQSTTLAVEFTAPGSYPYTDTRADTDREMYGNFVVTGSATSTSAATTAARTTTGAASPPPRTLPLRQVADVPLPGGASRFDYQSVDADRRRLFVAHLGGGDVVVFDLARRHVAKDLGGVAGVHGVLVAPQIHRLYATATGRGQLVTFDERTLQPIRRAPAGSYPDGIAWDARDGLVFVSDETGDRETVFRAASGRRIGAVALGGDAGNVQYDGTAGRILVDVGSRDELAVLDPVRRKVVRRVPLQGCDHPHGLHLDTNRRLAFVACDGNAALLVVDLRTMRVVQAQSVGDDPDVLDLDPGLHRLYVAAESGEVAVFAEEGRRLRKLGQAMLADHAHSVAVDPETHLVYFPLEDVGGRPLLRIMRPVREG